MPSDQNYRVPEFTASDILSPKLWQPDVTRPPLGIDITCTKVAVDFQNLTAESADAVIRQNLGILREATGTDVVFMALFDPACTKIDSIVSSRAVFARCRPEVLKDEPLDIHHPALPQTPSLAEFVQSHRLRDPKHPDSQRPRILHVRRAAEDLDERVLQRVGHVLRFVEDPRQHPRYCLLILPEHHRLGHLVARHQSGEQPCLVPEQLVC